MKATLEFDLPEDDLAFKLAVSGDALHYAIAEVLSELRQMLKYDKGFDDIPDEEKKMTVEQLRDLIWSKLSADKNVKALFD